MKYAFLIFSIIIFTLLSCKKIEENNQNEVSLNSKPVKTYYTKSLKEVGSLKIPIDLETTFYAENIQYVDKLDEELLITLPNSSNTLNIYNLRNKDSKQVNKIILNTEGANSVGGEASGFHYHNKDSIFILSKFTFKVFLININGKVKESYEILNEYDSKLPVPLGSSFSPLKFVDGKIYLSCDVASEQKNGAYENLFIEYDIQKKKTLFKGKNPEKLNKGSWERVARLYYDYNSDAESFILAYNIADDVLNFKSQNNIKKYTINSNYINDKDIIPFSTTFRTTNDYIERAKYSLSIPKYWGIKYDPFRKSYYRFGVLKSSYSDLQRGRIAEKVIIVTDENFKTIAEEKMHPTRYEYDMSFVGEKGLYIANREKYNEDDNFITFDIFNIE